MPTTTSTDIPPTSGGNNIPNDSSDSEESALIVWEDEASKVDFRHFLLNEDTVANTNNGMEGGGAGGNNFGDAAEDGNHHRLRLLGSDAGLDRRGGRRRLPLPVAMTQQIEELSTGSSSSSSDDDGLKSTNATMTPPPTNPRRFFPERPNPSAPKIISRGSAAEQQQHGQHHDAMMTTTNSFNAAATMITASATAAPPGSSKLKRRKHKRNLVNDEGDIPATISKLRRQNHGTRRGLESNSTSSHTTSYPPPPASPTTTLITAIVAGPQKVMEKENQPPPQQEIMEVRKDEKDRSANSANNCNDEPQSERQHPHSTKSKLEVGLLQGDDRTAFDDLWSNDFASSASLPPPPTAKNTDTCDSFPDIQHRYNPQQHDLSVFSQADHANLHRELQHLQRPPSSTKSASHRDDNGCRDLFREIELGLDRVCGAPEDADAIVHGIVDSIGNPGTSIANSTDIASDNTSSMFPATKDEVGNGVDNAIPGVIDDNDEDEEWNDDDLAAIDLSVAMVANLNRPSQIMASVVPPSSASSSLLLSLPPHHQRTLSAQKQSSLSSSTSATNCYRATSIPNRSASSLSPHSSSATATTQRRCSSTLTPVQQPPGSAQGSKAHCDVTPNHEFKNFDVCGLEDDESWNEEDLAAIDLSVALTRSSLNSTSTPKEAESTTSAVMHHPPSPNMNQNGVVISEDDDRYFAEMDFHALDDTIVRHEQRQNELTRQKVGMQSGQLPTHRFPPPPPPFAPIFNRRRQLLPIESSSMPTTSFLSFTRYTVQIVKEDSFTHTKTIGVSLWSNSQDDKKKTAGDELDDLISIICMEQSKKNDSRTPACGNLIDGYLHLRGEWYHTSCQAGDIVQLCSLGGDYLTDASALPVVLHSNPPPSSDPDDDLLLVLHPDELLSPTIVSEAVQCPRLAVLRSRLGSTGMSSRSAVIGILRHELFERCLRERDASHKSAAVFTRQIIRSNADALLGCGVINQREAFGEVMKTLSQIQLFLRSFTSWNATKQNTFPQSQQKDKQPQFNAIEGGVREDTACRHAPTTLLKGMFASCDTLLEIRDVYSTEQWMHVPEVGLKGNVDATVVARVKPLSSSNITSHDGVQDLLLPVELKTGHVQNPNHNHLAQLSIYTMMLRARQGSCTSFVQSRTQNNARSMSNDPEMGFDVEALGAASSGMLLYLNHENYCARHVKPTLNDVKTLMGQRNKLASNMIRSSRPRGIALEYEDDEQNSNNTNTGQNHSRGRVVVKKGIAPPSALPELYPNVDSCKRCYKNRECMMYASADINSNNASSHPSTLVGGSSHKILLDHFTGHLQGADLEYFCKWDMLIDIERHASSKNMLSSWLYESENKESKDGKCISSLALEFVTEDIDGGEEEDTLIRFTRSKDATHTTPLSNLNFEVGSHAIISEDDTSFASKSQKDQKNGAGRRGIHILRGAVVRIGDNDIDIAVPSKDIDRFKRQVKWGDDSIPAKSATSTRYDVSCKVVRKKFRLDKDEYVGLFGLLLQNLVNFFTLDIPPFSVESFGSPVKTKSLTADTEISSRRRRLNSCIVQLEPCPRFLNMSVDSIFTCDESVVDLPGCDYNSLRRDFDKLNSDQKEAVLKVVSAEDFALIQGLPGTGKSETISFITRLLVMRGKRVLLTSYTHSAVDNLLCKLMESGLTQPCISQKNPRNPIIRIGQLSSCHLQIRPLLAHAVARDIERFDSGGATTSLEQPSVEYLHKVISEAKVVGVSALTVPRSPLLAGQNFDVVIVDEAGQISQPAVLGAIMAANSFVLVGDHMQLPPLVISEVAEEGGFGISMLKRLADAFPDAIAILRDQYRMNESICHLSNIIAYQGLLRCGSDQVRHQKLDLCMSMIANDINPIEKPWIKRAINPDNPVVFLDTDGKGWLESDESAGGQINTTEVSIVQNIVHSLSLCGLDPSSIGVITPFRSQLRALDENHTLQELKGNGLEICTIDRFQGRDKSAIILSLVRSNSEGKTGRLLQDYRRLNVAFSRAKKKMIIVGSFTTLCKGSHVLCPVLEFLRERNWVYKMM